MPVPAPDYELDQFFDLSLDLLCIAGFDGYFKRVNASFERALGYSREQLLSRPFLELVHPDDVERAHEVLGALSTGSDAFGFESRLVCADGAVRRFEWNTRTVPDLGVVYGIARDVTERTQLAEEQAALRRVATLVARQASPGDVFAAVAEEMGRLVGIESTGMFRYEDGTAVRLVASWGRLAAPIPVGTRLALGGNNISSQVFRTARPARIDRFADASGPIGDTWKALGIRAGAGTPIVVDGRLWGAMVAVAAAEPLPEDIEFRMREFSELVATAIANIDARAALTASRARIVAAADRERRRVVRDLHDGAQQRLVHTVLELKLAQRALERGDGDARSLVNRALEHAERANHELRELAHGILPAALTTGGLQAGVGALASRMPVPVDVEISTGRLPATIEATAYFVVSEALTNVAKHARAGHAEVAARVETGTLQVEVRDDGVGGARADGSGFQGLEDRLEAIDGRLRVESPTAGGTLIEVAIPIPPQAR